MIYALNKGFTLLNKKNKLMFVTLMRCLAKDIKKNILYTALSMSIYKKKVCILIWVKYRLTNLYFLLINQV